MEILKEMVSVLFKSETIRKAIMIKQLTLKNEHRKLFHNGTNYRLFHSQVGHINLEVEIIDSNGIFYKPIGYFEFETSLRVKPRIFILNEFKDSYHLIKETLELDRAKDVNFLTIEENAYIAICSRGVTNEVIRMFNSSDYSKSQDINLISNGLKVKISALTMNFLEVKLNEDAVNENIFITFEKNYDNINTSCFNPIYDLMCEKSLIGFLK